MSLSAADFNLEIIEDRQVPHRAGNGWSGIVIGRVQRIRNTLTGVITEVNYWYENDSLHHLDSYEVK